VKQYQWPVFNLADSSIVIGACLLVMEIVFSPPKTVSDSTGEIQP
jgi:lipoprotein signal peptidase